MATAARNKLSTARPKRGSAKSASQPKSSARTASRQAQRRATVLTLPVKPRRNPKNAAAEPGNKAQAASLRAGRANASGSADSSAKATQAANDPLRMFGTQAFSLGGSLAQGLQGMGNLSWPEHFLSRVQDDYLRQVQQWWDDIVLRRSNPVPEDKRFASEHWAQQPMAAFMAAMYLLNAQTLSRMAEGLQGDDTAKARMKFAVQQWVEAACPANYLALNPEALNLALQTKGESLKLGLQHLLQDLAKGQLSQTDEARFEVGKNLAITPGSVVFENELFQLIEYRAQTAQVHQRPLLMVPPCINKFYILDLQPGNSLVEYAVAQGFRVFMVSWINPKEDLAQKTWDDYTEDGVIRAIDVVRDISGQDTINTLGFCIGGTLLAAALSVLQGRGRDVAESMTLLTAFLDFSNTGVMDVFIDEAMVKMRELTIGAQSPDRGGMMHGRDLATTFSFLRPTDLVWNYVVGNYLKGTTPPAFDLLYWNADSTNLPGPMYCWYLRNTYLENNLVVPGKVRVCGQPIHFQRLRMPTFIYGSKEDHIVPWDSAYASTQILRGPKTFVLGASGHIAGVINPPAKNKRHYWTSTKLTQSAPDWFASAREHPGSWWPQWTEWLASHSGPMVKAPKGEGNRHFKPLEAAPGRYVKARA